MKKKKKEAYGHNEPLWNHMPERGTHVLTEEDADKEENLGSKKGGCWLEAEGLEGYKVLNKTHGVWRLSVAWMEEMEAALSC